MLAADTVMRFYISKQGIRESRSHRDGIDRGDVCGPLGAAASIALATMERPRRDYHRHNGPNMRLNVLNFAGTHPTWITKIGVDFFNSPLADLFSIVHENKVAEGHTAHTIASFSCRLAFLPRF
jgi:hypothetical protein